MRTLLGVVLIIIPVLAMLGAIVASVGWRGLLDVLGTISLCFLAAASITAGIWILGY